MEDLQAQIDALNARIASLEHSRAVRLKSLEAMTDHAGTLEALIERYRSFFVRTRALLRYMDNYTDLKKMGTEQRALYDSAWQALEELEGDDDAGLK